MNQRVKNKCQKGPNLYCRTQAGAVLIVQIIMWRTVRVLTLLPPSYCSQAHVLSELKELCAYITLHLKWNIWLLEVAGK